MTRFLAAGALALLALQAPVLAQDRPLLPGRYELTSTRDDGTTRAVELEVERDGAKWVVTRKAKLAGEPKVRWDGVGRLTGRYALSVRYEAAPNVFSATYALSEDGRALTEVVVNERGLAPEAGWSRADASGARALGHLTYGELAGETLYPLFVALGDALGGFGPTTLPHEAKALRKQIGKVRAHLDLFVFAYPRGNRLDPWQDLREALDDGYEAMGAFKDLYDVQNVADPALAVYDPVEVTAARREVLDWLAGFATPDRLGFYRHFLAEPKTHRLFDRDADELSPYSWGGVRVRPRERDAGIETVARLVHALLDDARDDLDEVLDLRDVIDEQEHFHGFRKRLRGALDLGELFPGVYQDAADAGLVADLTLLDEAVSRCGDLNDRIVAHARAVRRGERTRARDLEDEIEQSWRDLRRWLKDMDADDAIHDVRREID